MKNVLIIGATSAIAQKVAILYAQKNDKLFLVARNEEKLKAVAADLTSRYQVNIEINVANLNDFDKHKDIINKATQFLGSIDIALIAHGSLADQKECENNFQLALEDINTNFLSAASLLSLMANIMENQKNGTIAAITSVAGDRGRQSNYIYGAAKGGLGIFLQGLRNRLAASSVHVLEIKPGFVDTPMTSHIKKGPLFASPENIAAGIVKAIENKKNIVYLPFFWFWILLIIKNIPESIFKKMKL